MSQVSEYAVKLTADISEFTKNVSSVGAQLALTEKQAGNFSRQMEKALTSANPAANRLGQSMAKLSEAYKAQVGLFQTYSQRVADAGKKLEALTQTHSKQQQQIAATQLEVNRLAEAYAAAQATYDAMQESMANGTSIKAGVWSKITAELEDAKKAFDVASASLNEQKAALSSTEEQMTSYGQMAQDNAARSEEMATAAGNSKNQMLAMAASVKTLIPLKSFFAGLGDIFKKLTSNFGKLAVTGIKSFASNIKNAAKRAKEFHQQTNVINKAVSKLSGTFNSFGSLLIRRFKRQIISQIFSGLKEGIQNVAKESSSFNLSVSGMGSSLKTFANQLGAAFAPLAQIAAPAITGLINMLTSAMNTVSAFTARITGKDYYKQALPVAYDYAASLDKTAKNTEKATKAAEKYKRTILSFDQLHTLGSDDNDSSNNSSTASTETASAPAFKDVAVGSNVAGIADKIAQAFKSQNWTELGGLLASGVNSAFEWVKNIVSWDNAGKKITEVINGITGTFNAFIAGLNPGLIGSTFGELANTIINSIALLQNGIDWKAIGTFLGESLRSALENTNFEELGAILINGVESLLEIVNGFVSTPGLFDEIGKALKDSITGMIDNLSATEWGDTAAKLVNGIFTAIGEIFSDKEEFGKLGEKIASNINTFFEELKPEEVAEGVNSFCQSLLTFASKLVGKLDWKTIGTKIGDTLAKIDWLSVIGAIGIVLLPLLMKKLPALALLALTHLGALLPGLFAAIIANPMAVLIVAGIAAFGVAIYNIVKTIKEHWKDIKKFVLDTAEAMKKGLAKAWKTIKGAAKTAWKAVKNAVTAPIKAARDMVGNAVNKIIDFMSFSGISEKISNALSTVKDLICAPFESAWDTISGIIEKIKNFNPWEAVESAKNALSSVGSGISSGFRSVGNFIGNGLSHISFASGGFPEDGLFFANHNELVGGFSNGKTAVANNAQIITGIQDGVASAVAPFLLEILSAIRSQSGGDIVLTLDGERLARSNMRHTRAIQNREYAVGVS